MCNEFSFFALDAPWFVILSSLGRRTDVVLAQTLLIPTVWWEYPYFSKQVRSLFFVCMRAKGTGKEFHHPNRTGDKLSSPRPRPTPKALGGPSTWRRRWGEWQDKECSSLKWRAQYGTPAACGDVFCVFTTWSFHHLIDPHNIIFLLVHANTHKIDISPESDFYAHIIDDAGISKSLVSSAKLLTSKKVPTVIHFYDGGWGGCRPCAAQMEVWASRYGKQVQFLMVCVDASGSLYFHHLIQSTKYHIS